MKAIVTHKYGSPDALELEEMERPTPADNEVLIKVHAASVNAGDWHILRADPFIIRFMMGFKKPKYKVLGSDVAGEVEAVGKDVKQFQPGDRVFGELSSSGYGAFAEYASAREDALAPMPTDMSFDEAASVPMAALTALQSIRDKGRVQPGQKVLINGASGGVGTFAVQIARALGAEVTGVCSTRNVEMVRSLGADHVIDYTKEDFTDSEERYDVILGVNGDRSIFDYRQALKPDGTYVMSGGSMSQMVQAMFVGPWLSMRGKQKLGTMLQKTNQEDLLFLKELIEDRKVRPVIDRCYTLTEVPEAIRYLEDSHAQGKVVITV